MKRSITLKHVKIVQQTKVVSQGYQIFALNLSNQLYKNADIAQVHIHTCSEKTRMVYAIKRQIPHLTNVKLIKYTAYTLLEI